MWDRAELATFSAQQGDSHHDGWPAACAQRNGDSFFGYLKRDEQHETGIAAAVTGNPGNGAGNH